MRYIITLVLCMVSHNICVSQVSQELSESRLSDLRDAMISKVKEDSISEVEIYIISKTESKALLSRKPSLSVVQSVDQLEAEISENYIFYKGDTSKIAVGRKMSMLVQETNTKEYYKDSVSRPWFRFDDFDRKWSRQNNLMQEIDISVLLPVVVEAPKEVLKYHEYKHRLVRSMYAEYFKNKEPEYFRLYKREYSYRHKAYKDVRVSNKAYTIVNINNDYIEFRTRTGDKKTVLMNSSWIWAKKTDEKITKVYAEASAPFRKYEVKFTPANAVRD